MLSISKINISRLSQSTHLNNVADPRFCMRASEKKRWSLDSLRECFKAYTAKVRPQSSPLAVGKAVIRIYRRVGQLYALYRQWQVFESICSTKNICAQDHNKEWTRTFPIPVGATTRTSRPIECINTYIYIYLKVKHTCMCSFNYLFLLSLKLLIPKNYKETKKHQFNLSSNTVHTYSLLKL